AARPSGAQRTTAALLRQVDHVDGPQLVAEPARHRERAIAACVVRDGDPPVERKCARQEAVQAQHGRLQRALLVEDRDDNVDAHGWPGTRCASAYAPARASAA